ncbi:MULTISPECIES: helix-turn-helix domain-containing protein [unclassified Streptomyces]|uniref:helix-turn-helix domain-containing protein n=1 Tax=unclassified Streptomyces TaxID=2593676 RepID=UPI00036484CC|nr:MULTISPECIES: helix-turn-helix domain-containing protein [unclassified Streptomyces]MYQ77628.1 helix-turn-helix domain-containing protein [Streptomyces sp. SID4923]
MPGGRLSQQERRQIGRGLADGLAYAEIARQLNRPTSTITREVTRNGGPAGYRADVAHRTAEQRAHRRKNPAPRDARPDPQPYGRDAEAVRAYEEMFTTAMTASGAPQMMSRVLAALTLSDTGSLTAGELASHLKVSPASVSKAVAFLETQSMVRREREGRRERYVVDDELMHESMMASAHSTAQLAETARKGVPVLGADTAAGTRLENMARYLDFVSESIARAAEQARAILHTKAPEPGP